MTTVRTSGGELGEGTIANVKDSLKRAEGKVWDMVGANFVWDFCFPKILIIHD